MIRYTLKSQGEYSAELLALTLLINLGWLFLFEREAPDEHA